MLNQIYLPCKTVFRVCDSVVDNNGTQVPIVEGELSSVDEVSPNGYRYRKGFWNKVLAEDYVKDMILGRECLGTIEHPESDDEYLKTSYENASHVVFSVVVNKAGNPVGRFGLLNNNKGNSIKALIDLGVPIGVSTRGFGEILEDEVSKFVSENNYALITWDFTKNPNFPKKMKAISDSLLSSPSFREYCEMRKVIDSTPYKSPLSLEAKRLLFDIKDRLSRLENLL